MTSIVLAYVLVGVIATFCGERIAALLDRRRRKRILKIHRRVSGL